MNRQKPRKNIQSKKRSSMKKNAINFPIKITTFIGKHIKTKKIDKNSMRCNFANERLHLDWQNLDEKSMTSRSTQRI